VQGSDRRPGRIQALRALLCALPLAIVAQPAEAPAGAASTTIPATSIQRDVASPGARIVDGPGRHRDARVSHARELQGPDYERSVVRHSDHISHLIPFIEHTVSDALPAQWKHIAVRLSGVIVEEGRRHGVDPILLMALIHTESSFRPHVTGGRGEIGLMQIRPETGRWIADETGVAWQGSPSLQDPFMNVRIGTAYLAWLRDGFDGDAQLYLAAYNMGPSRVRSAVRKDIRPRTYAARVIGHYVEYYARLSRLEPPAAGRAVEREGNQGERVAGVARPGPEAPLRLTVPTRIAGRTIARIAVQ
jgi:hypothetical protein